VLIPSAVFEDAVGSSFSGRFTTDSALRAFMDLVLRYPRQTSTVRMFLKPRRYVPAESAPAEFLPSSLYFDVDRERGVAAAALLIVDAHGVSHQWLSQGDRGRDDVALVMDQFNPEFATFPQESFVAVEPLADAVVQWAFGDEVPPPALSWKTATEDEVGWPVGAGY
jgi:hypothetical protein